MFAPSILASAASSVAAGANVGGAIPSRRSSFRVPGPDTDPYNENSPSPEQIETALFVEEDRRMRRRGSQL